MRKTITLAALLIALSVVGCRSQTSGDSRVEKLMLQLTPDEKLSLLGGVDGFYTRPIERLGIPKIKMTDGPNGTRNYGPSTAFPAGVLLAATWEPSLAMLEGVQLGRDAKARGAHVLLGPGVNIYRHPRNGRNFEYFGEDPILAGDIAAAYIDGVQSQGVSATIKHFAANNQETDRDNVDVEVDERTLREIYLKVFERAIAKANPGAVMCSYNRINGVHSSANAWLLDDVLRGDWGYDGLLMSDWSATHTTLGPVQGGLDLEMPDAKFMNAAAVAKLVESGVVPQATIDTKVRRLLRWMNRFGWLDREIKDDSIPLENPQGGEAALAVARAGITLLRNDRGLLPLKKQVIRRVVVLGQAGQSTPVGGGGSGYTRPFRSVSVLDGLRRSLGNDRVTFALGDPLLKLANAPAIDGGTFHAEYFAGTKLNGAPVVSRDEKTIDFDDKPDGLPRGKFSARYRASITPGKAATYTFFTRADDGARVMLDGKTILDDWSDHQARTKSVTVDLEAGRRHELTVEYYDNGGQAALRFGCGVLPPAFDEAELAALRDADAVVVCVGFSQHNEGEGSDRSYELPDMQSDLVVRAAAESQNTVVVLTAGGSCDVSPWIDRVSGLLHTYYAGQEGGTAIAEILLGDTNPSGRLPFSFEAKLDDLPTHAHFGTKDVVEYAEGVFVGYRGFDRAQIEPRFPFGFGLSYTSFKLENAKARRTGDAIVVTAEITNTGDRDGAVVVQCYIEPPSTSVPRPVRELKAFAKPTLKPSEKRSVELRIPREDLAYWDIAQHAWVVTPGEYKCRVGFSSRDLPVTATVNVR